MKIQKKLHKIFKKLFFIETWNIGILKGDVNSFLNKSYLKKQIVWLPKIFGHTFKADPFGFELNGKKYIIYEYFSYFECKGKIDLVELDGNLHVKKHYKHILKSDHHLSYPHPIKYKGGLYFLVECNKSRELALYKFKNDKFELEKVKTLIEGEVVDASIVQKDKKWWLFFTLENKGWDKLFVAYSDDLFGEWKMHKKNPVKTDLSSARCGGTIFENNGSFYRPAQDCSRTYGGAISICEIKKLTVNSFEELVVNHIDPFTKYSDGIHTISKFGKLILIDGKGRNFSILKPIISWKKNLKRLIKKL